MARVIVTATPITGLFASMWVVARDLVERGHEVSFVTGESLRGRVEETGASFRPMDFPDFGSLMSSAERLVQPSSFPRLEWDLLHMVIARIPAQYAALQAEVADARGEPVVLVADQGVLGSTVMGFDAPGPRPDKIITIGTSHLALSSVDTAPFGMGLPPDSTPGGRARNRVATAYVQQEALAGAQREFVRTLRGLGVEADLPFFMDAPVHGCDTFLQLGVEEMAYPRSDLPPHVEFVGALPVLGCGAKELPHWWPDVEAADKVVVVTQGTVAFHDLGHLVEPTLEALADEPVLVVAATGRNTRPLRVPANARVAPLLPFDSLLPRAAALVTNGEFGTAQQALRSGVPMVLAGQSEDKLEGNVRLAATGSAVNMATDRPAIDQLRTAIDVVTTDPFYRFNAQRLAADLARLDTLRLIAQAVDEATVAA